MRLFFKKIKGKAPYAPIFDVRLLLAMSLFSSKYSSGIGLALEGTIFSQVRPLQRSAAGGNDNDTCFSRCFVSPSTVCRTYRICFSNFINQSFQSKPNRALKFQYTDIHLFEHSPKTLIMRVIYNPEVLQYIWEGVREGGQRVIP